MIGTMFEATKPPRTRWFMAMQLSTEAKNNVFALESVRQFGVSCATALLMKYKIMEAMREEEGIRRRKAGVDVADAYFGGERSGGKTGRGLKSKVPFVAAVQVANGGQPSRVCMTRLPFRRNAIAEFAAAHLQRPRSVVSDGLGGVNALAEAGMHLRIASQAEAPQVASSRCFVPSVLRSSI